MSSSQPTVSLSSGATAFLGTKQTVDVQFSNTGTAPGYGPYVVLNLGTLGANGLNFGAGDSVSFLGAPITNYQTGTYDANGDFTVPGSSVVITGGTPGAALLYIPLPFGSFTPGQTTADVQVTLNVPTTAAIGTAEPISASGGFLYGNAATGSTPLQTGYAPLSITPGVLATQSTYGGPAQELATGPSNSAFFTVSSAVAMSAAVTDLTLTDTLPNGAIANSFTLQDPGTGYNYVYTVDPATGALSYSGATLYGTSTPATAPSHPTIESSAAGTAPWVYYDAASQTLTADFGSYTGASTSPTDFNGPSIVSNFSESQYQTLGDATVAGVAGQNLVVTDELPYTAVSNSFTISDGLSGTYVYDVSNTGSVTLASSSSGAAAAPAIVTTAAQAATDQAAGTRFVYYDVANGKIVSDFGIVPAGTSDTGSIAAEYSNSGQYQLPNTVTGPVTSGASGSSSMLVDQLNGGAVVNTVTVTDSNGSYVYDVSSTGTLTYDAAASTGAPGKEPGIGTGAGDTAANTGNGFVYYDQSNNRIVANFASSDVVSGSSATITAGLAAASGGQVLQSSTTPTDTGIGNNAGASAGYSSASGSVAVSATPTPVPPATNVPGSNEITAKPIALQKVVDNVTTLAPNGVITWSVNGEVSNYSDVGNIVVTDTLSDGQHFDGAVTPTIDIVDAGVNHSFTLTAGEYSVGARDAVTGKTVITVNVSKVLTDNGLAADLNGGAAPNDATANPTLNTFSISLASVIDTNYLGSNPGTTTTTLVEQGDSLGNGAIVTGTLENSGATVSDNGSASVSLPVGAPTKTVYAVNGVLVSSGQVPLNAAGQPLVVPGDTVTYELSYNLPLTTTSDLTLTDYEPLPVINVTEPNGTGGSYSFANTTASGNGVPGVGVIEYAPTNQLTSADLSGTPNVSVNAGSNSFTVNFGQVTDPSGTPNSTVNLLFSTVALDQPFINGLDLTNELTASEVNSFGNATTQSAIQQIEMIQPVMNVQKGVVGIVSPTASISGTDAAAQFNGGTADVATAGQLTGLTGTIDNATVGLSDTARGLQGGDTVEYAVEVQNTGSADGYNITLDDTLPSGITAADVSNIRVTDGAGHTLSVVGGNSESNLLNLFTTGGVELANALAADTGSATQTSDIAVITYDVTLPTTIAQPVDTLTNTATVTNFAAQNGGTNFVTHNNDTGTLSASNTVTTEAPITTKVVTATSENAAGSSGVAANAAALKLGETVTFTVTTTLGEGSYTNLTLQDLLPSGANGTLSFVSGQITGIGSAITVGSGAVGSAIGTLGVGGVGLDLGNVTVASDANSANDQITYTVTAAFEGGVSGNAGGETLTNKADVQATSPQGGTYTSPAGTASVTTVAPQLSISKQVEDVTANGSFAKTVTATAGDTLTYRVGISDSSASTSAPAYQVVIKDPLAALASDINLANITNVEVVTSGGSIVAGATASFDSATGTVTANIPTLNVGGTDYLEFTTTALSTDGYSTSFVNTGSYTADSLPSTDSTYGTPGYDKTYSGSSSATVTIAKPVISKTLISGSDTSQVALPNLVQGETATFQVLATLVEGSSSDLKIVDTLPSGFNYVSASIVGIGAGITAANPGATASVSGNAVTFDLGATQSTGSNDVVTIDVTGTVQNTSSIASGTKLTNTASVESAGTVLNTASATATIDQPTLVVTKTPSGIVGDAGQTVSYVITIANAGSAPADAVVLTDTNATPADLSLSGFTATVGGQFASTASGFTFTPTNPIAVGQTVTIDYTGTYTSAVQSGQSLVNTASASYASLTTGGFGQVSNTATATESVKLTPAISKTLLSASYSNLAAGQVEAGEQLVYQIAVTPGNGTQNLTIADVLPAGLSYVGASVASAGGTTATTGTLADSGTGNNLQFSLSNIVDPAGNSGSILIDVTADVAGSVTVGQTIDNSASVTSTALNGTGAQVANSGTVDETVVAPKLSVTKAVSIGSGSGDAGTVADYTVTYTNGGTAPADNVVITDTDATPGGLILGTPTAVLAGTGTAVAGSFAQTANGFTFTPTNPVPAGQTVVISYTGTFSSAVTPAEVLANSVSGTYTAQPGGTPVLNSNTASASVNVSLSPSITKTLLSVSDTTLPAGKVEAGEQVVYQLAVVPGNGTQSLVLTDVLPSGLTYVGASLASAGGTTATTVTDTGSGNDAVLSLGTITDPIGNTGTILVDVTADVAGGVVNGQTIANAASVTSAGPGGVGASTATSGTVDLSVITPSVSLLKTVQIISGTGDAGTVAQYTIQAVNAGSGPAYDLAILDTDATPGGLVLGTPTAVIAGTSTAVAGTFTNTAAGFSFQASGPIAAGETIDIIYNGTFSSAVTPGEVLANTASGSYATQPTGGTVANTNSSTATADVTITSQISKTIIATSDQADIGTSRVADGETVTYQLVGTIEPGTSNLVITDSLPAGMVFQSASLVGSGAIAPTSSVGGVVRFDLGAVTVPAGPNGTVTLDVTALDSRAASSGTLTNTATLTSSGPGGAGSVTTTAQASSTIVAPDLTLTKATSFTTGDAGSVATFTMTIDPAADMTSPAYNVSLLDLMPNGLTLVAGSEHITGGSGSFTEAGNGFDATIADIAPGAGPIVITYQAALANNVVNAATITNTGTLDYTSQPDTVANGNTGGEAFSTTAQASVGVTLVDQVSKTLVDTSYGAPQASAGGVIYAAPGEMLTYDVVGTLDTGTQHLVLSDSLPAGLTYVSSSVVSLGDSAGSALAVGASGSFNAATDTVSFDFGTAGLTNPAGSTNSDVVVQVVAQVGASDPVNEVLTDTGRLVTSAPVNTLGVAPGANPTTLDAQASVTVGGGTIKSFVFFDGQCDGVYHVGDAGVAGVTVHLLSANGQTVLATTTTDSAGQYTFTEVPQGSYQVQVVAPAGTRFSHSEPTSNPLIDNDVNSQGVTGTFSVIANQTTQGANAGLIFNGDFAGQTPIQATNGVYDGNGSSGVIVSGQYGGNNIHTGSGGNNVVVLSGSGNIIELGAGNGTDIGTSCGSVNAQTQGASNGYLFAGGSGSVLQGGSGNTYLMGGAGGSNQISNGAGTNILIPGGPNSEVRTGGASTTILYQAGDGALLVDNGLGANATLDVFGYSSGTLEIINSQEYLNLGNGDLIHFNGGTTFDGRTGVISNGSGPSGIQFFASITTPPTESLSFGANGLPVFGPTGGAVTPAPTAAPTPAPTVPPATPTPTVPPATPAPTLAPTTQTLSGWNNVFTQTDNQSYSVTGSQGNATITLGGSGNNFVSAGGWGNVITLGDGHNTVVGPQGNSTVVVGNGDNSITLAGYDNSITTGGGSNTIVAGDGNETLHLGSGTNTVTLSGWNNLVIAGPGHDTLIGGNGNTFDLTSASGSLSILDFGSAQGDVLNLAGALAGGGTLSATTTATDTVLSIAPTGGSPSMVADLHGTGGASLNTLIAAHSVVV
jgi:fimbrial isopeptide formation D2 family protein/uncharacterized repeat protein (TIGR01451 family)